MAGLYSILSLLSTYHEYYFFVTTIFVFLPFLIKKINGLGGLLYVLFPPIIMLILDILLAIEIFSKDQFLCEPIYRTCLYLGVYVSDLVCYSLDTYFSLV